MAALGWGLELSVGDGVAAGGRPVTDRVTLPPLLSCRDPERHVKVKQRGSVLNMLRKLDKIRFRGHKRDDFLDLAESPNASDTECGDEIPLKIPRTSPRDSEELRDPVSTECPPNPAARPRSRGPSWDAGTVPILGCQAQRGLGWVDCDLPGWSDTDGAALHLSLPPPTSLGGAHDQIEGSLSGRRISFPSLVFWVIGKLFMQK